MKTASVRDLRQNFPRVLHWIQAGEEVTITLRRQGVARLVPCPRRKTPKKAMPDLLARLRNVFGEKVIADRTMKAILDQARGDF